MHRSGTSMACRLINLMGAYFGPEGCQHTPNEENPKGFWERKDFRALNDDMLAATGCSWHECGDWSLESMRGSELANFRQRARELVFGMEGFRPWVTKEPRFCLTFPVFRPFCESPVAVLVVRNPSEVAASLATRNGFPERKSLDLWHRYVDSALAVTDGIPRVLVRHEDLIGRPVQAARSIYDALCASGVTGLRIPSDREVEAFVDPGLYRSRPEPDAGDSDAHELYLELTRSGG